MTDKFSDKFLMKVKTLLNGFDDIKDLNEFLGNKTGIINFFKSRWEFEGFKQFLDNFHISSTSSQDLGDFQTPSHLTDKICRYLADIGFSPDAIIEPTCGEGNFVVSAIKFLPTVKYVYCVDIQNKYEWLFKLNILEQSLSHNINVKIEFCRDNIFTHEFSDGFMKLLNDSLRNLLILGNPPWVTSSELSILNSHNLPTKTNIKRYSGIEAITGKSNFDIAEYIILQIIQRFSDRKGKIAMLCKTSVIRNIVRDIPKLSRKIANIQALLIDTQKEFSINANAALFVADLGSYGETSCTVSSLYQPNSQFKKYGWIHNKFVSDVKLYKKYKYLDGRSPLEWRQGVKHDASKVMVLEITDNGLLNGLQEYVEIEEGLLYPFIRGSELRKPVIRNNTNKIIITQIKPTEDTSYIALEYPRLWTYLTSHSEYLDKRKSAIYKRRPRFSIFGIGSYSFMPYKVAISGLYKEPIFSLVFPVDNKPVMFDDTCYCLSFNSMNDAFFTWALLNKDDIRKFLSSIVFLDSKRPYTKEILMRIDLLKLAESISFDDIINVYQEKAKSYLEYEPNETGFLKFKKSLTLHS